MRLMWAGADAMCPVYAFQLEAPGATNMEGCLVYGCHRVARDPLLWGF